MSYRCNFQLKLNSETLFIFELSKVRQRFLRREEFLFKFYKINSLHKGDHRNGTKYEVTNNTPVGQLFRVVRTSGDIMIRKCKQISMTLEVVFC